MVKFIEPDVNQQQESVFQEPDLSLMSSVSDSVANTVAAQVGVIKGNYDFESNSFDDIDKQYASALQAIQSGHLSKIKADIAKQSGQDMLSLAELDAIRSIQTGDTQSDAFLLATQFSEQEYEAVNEVAIERAFSDKMAEYLSADEDNYYLVQDILNYEKEGTGFDKLMQIHERSMVLQRMMSEVNEDVEELSTVDTVWNFVATMVPLRDWYQMYQLESEDGIFQGDKAVHLNDKFYDLPEEMFPEFIKEFKEKLKDNSGLFSENPIQMMDRLDKIINTSSARVSAENTFGFVDATDVALIGTGLAKGIASKALMLTRFGQRRTADNIIANTLREVGDAPSLMNESNRAIASESAMVSGARVLEPLTQADVSNTLGATIVSNQERARKIIDGIMKDERMLDADKAEAIENTLRTMTDEYGASSIADVDMLVPAVRNDRGVTTVAIAIGKKAGGGFNAQSHAEAAINMRGLPEDSKVFRAQDGKYYIQIQRDIDEAFILDENVIRSPYNPLSKFFLSPASELPKWIQGRAESAGTLKGAFQKQMEPISKTITALNKKQYRQLGKVLLQGNIEAKWFNRSEFDSVFSSANGNRLPNDKQWAAYVAFKQLNDIDWAFRNWEMFVEKSRQGFQTGKVNTPLLRTNDVNMRKIEGSKDIHDLSIYDVDDGALYAGRQKGSDYIQNKLERGYELWRLDGTHMLSDKSGTANAVLIKKGNIRPGLLKMKQLPYREGGHRGPEGTYFLKQAQVGKFSTGLNYVRNPLTHAVGRTRSSLEDYAERMNKALDAYKYANSSQSTEAFRNADNIIREAGIEGGVDEFADMIDKGVIDANHKFEIVEGNDNPIPNISMNDEFVDLRDVNSFSSFVETQGKPYYGRKGSAPLRGPDDEVAKLIDPVRLMSKSLSDSLHRGNLANYRQVAADSWVKSFGSILRTGKGMNPRQIFFTKKSLTEADFEPHAPKSFVQAAINQHFHMQTQLSSYNEHGRVLNGFATRVANFVDGKGMTKFAGKLLDWRDADPITALRSLAYNIHLGLFQVDQLFVQTQTALNIAAMDPLKAPKLMERGAAFQALNFVTSDDALNLMAKAHKNPEEFKEFVRIGRERGMIDLYGDMAELDHDRLFNVGGPISVSNVAQKGRAFVMAAERYNAAVGYAKAWDELVGIHGLSNMRKPDVLHELARLKAKYSMNMSSMSAARWQKGVFGLPTNVPLQFLSYPIRFAENMLFSQQWSLGEKFRLGISHAVLYGGAGYGILGGSDIADPILESMGLDPNNEKDREAFIASRGGLVDYSLYKFMGIDGSLANRVGLAKAFRDTWDRLNGNDLNESSFFDVLTGPSGSLMKNFVSEGSSVAMEMPAVMFEAVRAERGDLAGAYTLDKLQNFASKNIASMNDGFKAYWAFATGEYISSRTGRVLLDGLDNTDAIGFMVGATPNKMLEAIQKSNMLKDDKQAVKSAAEQVSRLRNEEVRAFRVYLDEKTPESLEELERIWELKNLMLAPIRHQNEELYLKIIEASDSKAFNSMYETIEEEWLKRFMRIGEDGKSYIREEF